MLLIPADDLVAYIADDYLDELSEYYIIQNINDEPGALNRLMAKGKQKAAGSCCRAECTQQLCHKDKRW